MKKFEILRRRDMWWRRYLRSLERSNLRRQSVLYKNYVYWRMRFDFHFCILRYV